MSEFLRQFTSSLQDAADAVKDTASAAVDTVKDTASAAADTVQDAASSAVDTASAAVDTAKDTASAAAAAVQDAASSAVDTASAAVDTAKDTASAAAAAVQDAASSAVDTASAAVDTAKDTASAAAATVQDAASSAVDTVKETASAVGDAASAAVDTVEDAASAAVDTVKDAASSAIDSVQDAASSAVDSGKAAVSAAVKAVESAVSGASVGGQFKFGEVPLSPAFSVGQYIEGQVKGSGTVKFKAAGAHTGAGPSDQEVEAALKPVVDDLFAELRQNFKWVGGVTVKGDKKSIGISATLFKTSTKIGPVTYEFKGADLGFGTSGPKVSLFSLGMSYPPFPPQIINSIEYEVAISGSAGVEFKLNPAGVAEFAIEEGVVLLGDVLVLAAPLAFVVVGFAGAYLEIQEGYDEGEISAAAGVALRDFMKSYMAVMSGDPPLGGAAGGAGKDQAVKDLATLKAKGKDAETVVAQHYGEFWRAAVDAVKPKFRDAAVAAFTKKHALKVKVLGVPPSFAGVVDAYMNSYLISG